MLARSLALSSSEDACTFKVVTVLEYGKYTVSVKDIPAEWGLITDDG